MSKAVFMQGRYEENRVALPVCKLPHCGCYLISSDGCSCGWGSVPGQSRQPLQVGCIERPGLHQPGKRANGSAKVKEKITQLTNVRRGNGWLLPPEGLVGNLSTWSHLVFGSLGLTLTCPLTVHGIETLFPTRQTQNPYLEKTNGPENYSMCLLPSGKAMGFRS